MRARPEVALRSSSPGIGARRRRSCRPAFGSLNSGALPADSGPRYPIFAIKSYLGRCLAAQTPATTLVIADCDNAADQAFGVEELDPDHRVRLHLAEQCVGAQAMAADAAVRLEPCSDAPAQIFALDGDSIILDAKPELVVRLSNAITKPGTPVSLGERWLGDDELWDFVPPAGAVGNPMRGFVTVFDNASFAAALAAAGANSVIQLTPGAELDFQDLQCPFEIPAGVTLRGSRRGTLFGPQFWLKQGHLSTPTQTCEPGLFLVDQPRSRITGLRIRGPGRDPNGQMPPMKGVNVVACRRKRAGASICARSSITTTFPIGASRQSTSRAPTTTMWSVRSRRRPTPGSFASCATTSTTIAKITMQTRKATDWPPVRVPTRSCSPTCSRRTERR